MVKMKALCLLVLLFAFAAVSQAGELEHECSSFGTELFRGSVVLIGLSRNHSMQCADAVLLQRPCH